MDRSKKEQNNSNAKIGIIIGVLVLVLIAVLLIWKLHPALTGQPSATKPAESTASVETTATAPIGGTPAQTTAPTGTTTVETSTANTEPEQTEDQPTTETKPKSDTPAVSGMTYKEYLALDAQAQQAYYNQFASPDDFFKWFDSAKAEYEAATEPMETFGEEDLDSPF